MERLYLLIPEVMGAMILNAIFEDLYLCKN